MKKLDIRGCENKYYISYTLLYSIINYLKKYLKINYYYLNNSKKGLLCYYIILYKIYK